jgi:ATP-binding cassette subfamily B protein
LESLRQLSERRTTLYVTHSLDQAALADQIAYMEAGRILEQGTHEQLMRLDGKYCKLYLLQQTSSSPAAATTPPGAIEIGDAHAVAG